MGVAFMYVWIMVIFFLCFDISEDTEEEFLPPSYTPVNWILFALSTLLLCSIVFALLGIFFIHQRRDRLKRRYQILHRRRKATEYYHPSNHEKRFAYPTTVCAPVK